MRGISSKLHDRETKSNEECIKESMDLTQFILNYPYALDAENFEMFGD